MDKQPLGTKVITQIGIVVRDIESVSQAYADFLGVEKPAWFWTDASAARRTRDAAVAKRGIHRRTICLYGRHAGPEAVDRAVGE
ncbi:hypothetical protein C812_03421 [Paenibacillus barengoltzii G22]|uniref:Uncharacterized protein n=1 Tax=Paenibacillus barengoltzii G22 TaxID=1235795 RepID=R9L8D0_9BACL|nr:hypothetical protein C812_03421 [Paenibacillus barengoltzii G22]